MFFKKHESLFFIKLFSVNSIGVILRSFLSFISQKLIAVYLGPDGIALVGNLKNALNIVSIGATSGVDQGLLTYQSKLEGKKTKLKQLYSTSMAYSVIGSIVVALVLFLGASFWSQYLFQTPKYNFVFIILAITVPFTAIYNLCFAIINGKSDYKKATVITFFVNILVTLLVIFFVINYQLSGVLLAIAFTPIAQLLVLILFAKKELLLFKNLKIYFFNAFKNDLFIFIVMSFVAVAFSNIVDLQLRNYLINQLSLEEAGYWTSITSLSNYYLSFITGIYSLYILPKYAKINNLNTFINELKNIYMIVIPLFVALFIGIYVFRVSLIQFFFTKDFLPMQSLFKWQLLGDMVKITASIIAYQFIAQKLWKLFILTEVISFITLYIFGVYFVNIMGVEGVVLAHFLRYIIYLIIVIVSLKIYFQNKID